MHDVVVLDHASASSLNLLPGQPFHRCEVGINASVPLIVISNFFTYQVTTGLSAVFYSALYSIASCRPEAVTTVSNREEDLPPSLSISSRLEANALSIETMW